MSFPEVLKRRPSKRRRDTRRGVGWWKRPIRGSTGSGNFSSGSKKRRQAIWLFFIWRPRSFVSGKSVLFMDRSLITSAALMCRPTSVVVLPIRSTTTSRLTRGRPRQLAVMWQNIRCSILFHLQVSGEDGRPGSSALTRRPASGVPVPQATPIPMDAVLSTNSGIRWNDSACLASNSLCG